ncbi:MAG TPA: tetratricopeptide repeat protein [Bryobacteraceae bacterium]|jgi:tetratricopeptide (TPR) repeat protein|nr:tetratricopeptide repeat protein [Bryobacteraceae bacterium]
MRGNLPFPSRWLVPLWLVILSFTLPGQTYKVESGKTVTIDVPGVTAVYSLDSSCAEAEAGNGVVTVTGKIHGTTHVMAVTASGAQPLEIVVTDPQLKLLTGFGDPFTLAGGIESGYMESRYDATADQVQGQIDFSRRQDETTIHTHVAATRLLGDLSAGQSKTELSSAYYQISTPDRDFTILDQNLTESPLGITGSIVRGLHFRQDGWFLHAGYTSVSAFEGLFLPTKAEGVIEAGYRYKLTGHSTLTGSYYHFAVPSSDTIGRTGDVALLSYAYSPRENFKLTADAGFSRGLAGSALLDYHSASDTLKGTIRFEPSTFASLGANTQKGFHSDLSWTRQLTANLSSDVSFYDNTLSLPGIKQTTATAGTKLQYRLGDHWSVFGGATASNYDTSLPPRPPVRSLGAPAGLGFHSHYFGAQGQYQFTETTHQDSGSHEFRASVNAGVGPISLSAFGQQQTQAPTLSFLMSQTPGLQQAFDLLGIEATSIQQVEEILQEYAGLFGAGYIRSAFVNLAPLQSQVGSSFNWNGQGYWPQVSYNFLYNDNHGLSSSTVSAIHSLSYTQKLGSEHISLSYSLFGMRSPGQALLYKPSLALAWRHEIRSVPTLIIPEHHGAISGVVFRDDNSKGTYETGMPLIEGARVALDDTRTMETGASGAFRFSHVPVGKHRLVVSYHSDKPIFFSTQSDIEVDENGTANFGIGFSLSSLLGRIANDAGQGVSGVAATIRYQDRHWTATADSEGSFMVRQLTEGEYVVELDEDSIPEGYLTADLAPQTVKVGATTPGKAEFTVRAPRSIGGQVLAFDRAAAKDLPVAAQLVTLKELAKTSTTDKLGRYIFRDLPAGSYTVAVGAGPEEVTKSVKLPASPSTLTNIDLQIREVALAPAAPVESAPVPPMVRAAPAPDPPATPAVPQTPSQQPSDVDARQHERVGRQKLGALQYKEAIAELNEAIRLDPDHAPAYNARGFAWYRLYNFSLALADLDKAIELDPNYANAYRNRAAVRKAAGDLSGAAADLQKERIISATPAPPAPAPKAQPAPKESAAPHAPSSVSSETPKTSDEAGARQHIETAHRMAQAFQYREAIEELNQAIDLAPALAIAYNARGFAWFKLHELTRAIEDLDTAIRLNPRYANAYHIRGVVRRALGDRAGAEQDAALEWALTVKP